jgi:glycine/D-amino acid oxidase-like deaminating enzyme
MAGIDVPILPRRGQLLLTEPAKPILSHCLISAAYIAAKYDPNIAPGRETALSVEQTANGNFLLGSTREFVGYDRRTTLDGIGGIATRIARILPPLRKLRVIRADYRFLEKWRAGMGLSWRQAMREMVLPFAPSPGN